LHLINCTSKQRRHHTLMQHGLAVLLTHERGTKGFSQFRNMWTLSGFRPYISMGHVKASSSQSHRSINKHATQSFSRDATDRASEENIRVEAVDEELH
jgi:hypothetical protein